ncbi:MAG: HAD hydrolase family protein [Coriobacteriales bacterium]|jgi:3-deoxy-D-manno-octulosonate 8-phosphate phosphatase KdsC-like HAD superfamily phosphatase|nr:HAD hydrolase family protein [Coriobacteriales bacterium]
MKDAAPAPNQHALDLTPVTAPRAAQALAQVTHIYSDIDGTLLAPGGKLLANHVGEPSTAVAEALVALARAGVAVTLVTGRNRAQGVEILRLLNLQDFLGEMGTVVLHGYGPTGAVSYALGDWHQLVWEEGRAPGELPVGTTPRQLVEQSGALERLLQRFAGRLEPNNPYSSSHEVTISLRGAVDLAEVTDFLSNEWLPLQLMDNGVIHPPVHNLVAAPEIHSYHLMPRNTSKAQAVVADMARRGLRREQTVAIGDAVGDIEVGRCTGSLVVPHNALESAAVVAALRARGTSGGSGADTGDGASDGKLGVAGGGGGAGGDGDSTSAADSRRLLTFCTAGSTADGWVEFAHALLAAKRTMSPGA